MLLAQQLEAKVCEELKQIYSIKRFSKMYKSIAADTTNLIIANETPNKWIETATEYCKAPVDKNHQRVIDINKLAEVHQLDNYLAGILFASQKEDNVKTV